MCLFTLCSLFKLYFPLISSHQKLKLKYLKDFFFPVHRYTSSIKNGAWQSVNKYHFNIYSANKSVNQSQTGQQVNKECSSWPAFPSAYRIGLSLFTEDLSGQSVPSLPGDPLQNRKHTKERNRERRQSRVSDNDRELCLSPALETAKCVFCSEGNTGSPCRSLHPFLMFQVSFLYEVAKLRRSYPNPLLLAPSQRGTTGRHSPPEKGTGLQSSMALGSALGTPCLMMSAGHGLWVTANYCSLHFLWKREYLAPATEG